MRESILMSDVIVTCLKQQYKAMAQQKNNINISNLQVGKQVNIFANVNNLLNQPLRYYQGSEEQTMQAEYYNFRFDAGVKVIF